MPQTLLAAAVAIPIEIRADLQLLDEKVKSMMEKGQKMIPHGKQANGTPHPSRKYRAFAKCVARKDSLHR